ncbi:MAG: Type 1 glutamine amidotransferase-like domain-containing protein [Planctomycetota bacterium]
MKSASGARPILLLGPQGETPTLDTALERLGVLGPVATITAGWQELEVEDQALSEHLEGRARNLELFARTERLFAEDSEVRALLHERYDRLRELQELYRLRLAPQLAACRALFARTDAASPDDLVGPEIEDALDDVRALDAHHLARTARLDAEIHGRIGDRGSIRRHTDELRRQLEDVEAICIAGGHVGILLNRLRVYRVLDLAPALPIVAWSAGAMALATRIVLFHDSPPQGPGDAEVYASGLGLVRGVVPLPHARHRLRLDDAERVALFARRFAPDFAAALDGGESLLGTAGGSAWRPCEHTRRLTATGAVVTGGAA